MTKLAGVSQADHVAGEYGYVKFERDVPHGTKLYMDPVLGDPIGSFDKHMEYMRRNAELEQEVAKLRAQVGVWTDCNERMPEREVEVLVKYIMPGQTKPIVVAALRDKLFYDEERLIWWNSRGEAMSGKVTHWMVIPE